MFGVIPFLAVARVRSIHTVAQSATGLVQRYDLPSGVVQLVLNEPARLNALSTTMLTALGTWILAIRPIRTVWLSCFGNPVVQRRNC